MLRDVDESGVAKWYYGLPSQKKEFNLPFLGPPASREGGLFVMELQNCNGGN